MFKFSTLALIVLIALSACGSDERDLDQYQSNNNGQGNNKPGPVNEYDYDDCSADTYITLGEFTRLEIGFSAKGTVLFDVDGCESFGTYTCAPGFENYYVNITETDGEGCQSTGEYYCTYNTGKYLMECTGGTGKNYFRMPVKMY